MCQKRRSAVCYVRRITAHVLLDEFNYRRACRRKKKLLSGALDLFERARVTSFSRFDETITIEYELDGKAYTVKYDSAKGVLK